MIHSVKDLSPDQKVAIEHLLGRHVSEEELIRVEAAAAPASANPPCRHISEVIRDNMSDMPAEVLAALPRDGSSQHDHYIYGLPKRHV